MKEIKVKHYSPNVVYVLKVWGTHYYVGAHTVSYKKFLREKEIIGSSGCHLSYAYRINQVTRQEVFDNIELFHVEEYQTKEEALEREMELIKEYQDKYGSLCLNICASNKVKNKGIPCSEATKEKQRQAMTGHKFDEGFCLKVSKGNGGRPVHQFDLDGNFIAKYPYLAKTKDKGFNPSHIGDVCKGKRHTASGYIWRYAE